VNKEMIQQVTSSVIAVVVVVGTLGIVAYQIVHGEPVQVPSDIGILLGGVVGAYFTHAAAVNGARQAGTAAAQTAITAAKANGTNASGNP
jgi:hypothetical protein